MCQRAGLYARWWRAQAREKFLPQGLNLKSNKLKKNQNFTVDDDELKPVKKLPPQDLSQLSI
jgi:hypothetical protein